jgi:hypothetical protein
MCLDDAQKKFITGDVNGRIKVYNYLNGALMKQVEGYSTKEITSVLYQITVC